MEERKSRRAEERQNARAEAIKEKSLIIERSGGGKNREHI